MNDKEIFDTIGHNLKIERVKKRLTQAQLAELVDVHEKYIGKIETGKQNLTVKTLNKIAVALNTEITTFFTKHL